jgi:hypothetical protein
MKSNVFEETILAAQEWGIKNGLRLFGIMIGNMDFHGYGCPAENVALRAKGDFTDPAFKTIELHIFDIKEKSGVVSIIKTKRLPGFRWPIKFARTKEFESRGITPIPPLYQVLVGRGIILPFQSQLKNKEWAALPFEDDKSIKKTEV